MTVKVECPRILPPCAYSFEQPTYAAAVAELGDHLRNLHGLPGSMAMTQALPGEKPGDYYARVRLNPIALRVKAADIADNTDPDRLAQLDDATRQRLERKYANARAALWGAVIKHPRRAS